MTAEALIPRSQHYADSIMYEFHPIVSLFGFSKPQWDYDEDLNIVRVQFENSQRRDAVQIDYHGDDDSYSANYCQTDGDWQICREGKHKSLRGLRHALPRWIRSNCDECMSRRPEREEAQEEPYSEVRCIHCEDRPGLKRIRP